MILKKYRRIGAGILSALLLFSTCVSAADTYMISFDESWQYASYSEIHTGQAVLHKVDENAYTISVNAGHGTIGGYDYQTLCHPDGTPKVTGGSTAEGAVYATSISGGTSMLDGTPEGSVTLSLAILIRDKLMESGFNVLMLREQEDVQLDNIARTVLSNNNADCHISLHYDSSESDKGFFYISVPEIDSYRSMEPVASHWPEHIRLGESLLNGARMVGVPIFGNGNMAIDLTQTSYSTIPSVDVEVGDRASDYSQATQSQIADGIVEGLKLYFGGSAVKQSQVVRTQEEIDIEHTDEAQIHKQEESEVEFAEEPKATTESLWAR